MTCFDVRGTLSALIDGAATTELKGAALRHVDACADCRAELEALVGTDRIVKKGAELAAAAAPPAGYFDALASRIDRRIEQGSSRLQQSILVAGLMVSSAILLLERMGGGEGSLQTVLGGAGFVVCLLLVLKLAVRG